MGAMGPNETKFRWTPEREHAADLVADDQRTDRQIAGDLGIAKATLERWKKHSAFQERVQAIRTQRAQALRAEAEARQARRLIERANRLEFLNDRHRGLCQILEERAADPAWENVPGWKTGLMVHTVKGLGKGEDFQVVDEFAVDTGLLRELRELERQAAVETGQWTEKREIEHKGEVTQKVKVDDEAARLIADLIAQGLTGATPAGSRA
jgi:hypothetical protein